MWLFTTFVYVIFVSNENISNSNNSCKYFCLDIFSSFKTIRYSSNIYLIFFNIFNFENFNQLFSVTSLNYKYTRFVVMFVFINYNKAKRIQQTLKFIHYSSITTNPLSQLKVKKGWKKKKKKKKYHLLEVPF